MSTYLADTSALARLGEGAVGERLGPLILAGEVATWGVIDLEVGVTARNKANHDELCVGQCGARPASRGIDSRPPCSRRGGGGRAGGVALRRGL